MTFADPHLLAPDFVKMLEDDDYVYFFLREQAVEYINCGKVIKIFFFSIFIRDTKRFLTPSKPRVSVKKKTT